MSCADARPSVHLNFHLSVTRMDHSKTVEVDHTVFIFHLSAKLRRMRPSMDDDFTKTLVHTFISSGVDYCNAVFSGAPQYVIGTLQHVLNVAARLVTDICKYDRVLSTLIHDQLHWLNVPERVSALSTSWLSLSGEQSTKINCCTPVVDVASRHRRSANLHRLIVPRYQRSTLGRWSFSVGGLTV